MQNTQLACPHCGSTLNFGVAIAAGTPLECLICMQTFVAENPVFIDSASPTISVEPVDSPTLCPEVSSTMSDVSAAPTEPAVQVETSPPDEILPSMPPNQPAAAPMEIPSIARVDVPTESEPVVATIPHVAAPLSIPAGKLESSVKRAPKGEVLVSKPYTAPLTSGFADKGNPKPTMAASKSMRAHSNDETPSIRKSEDSAMGGTILLVAAAIGVLFILTGGIVFAAWKLTTLSRIGPAEEQFVVIAKKPPANADVQLAQAKAPEKKDHDDADTPAPVPLTPEEEDALRARIQEEVRQTLKRKNAIKPGANDPESDLIPIIAVGNKAITGLDQEKINAAIDKGVKYLRRTQNADGTWHSGHGVGYASIGGLTLLECGAVPAKDMHVQKAAAYVRAHSTNLTSTYELSLAILFLDRLGYERDRPLIQGMAMRLLAGQNDGGGWTYQCKQLNPKEMFQLYAFLQSHKQPDLLTAIAGRNPKTQAGIVVDPKRDPVKLDDAFSQLNDLIISAAIASSKPDPKTPPKKDDIVTPITLDPKTTPKDKPDPVKPPVKPIRPDTLLPSLQALPIVQNQGQIKLSPKVKDKGKAGRGGDNSNTQFAMLALWAARRHGVPTDTALLASYHRFMTPQNADGGWGYTPGSGTTNTMTNVGLLGLAMGHGAAPEIINFNPKNPKDVVIKPALQDASIQRGLSALSRYIGDPSLDPKKTQFNMENLYFLWSVERVAMLYDLKTIGGKDWYGWGAQILVHNQASGGEWPSSHYHGQSPPLNTCFALLFLRRSNLVQDLTNHLRLNTGIADPEK